VVDVFLEAYREGLFVDIFTHVTNVPEDSL